MSEVPAHETPVVEPVAVEPTTAVEPTIDAPTTDAVATTETPAVAAETPAVAPSTEENVGEDAVKVEAQPASEGVLGYKAPGLLNFRFSKKFFWFGSQEPVEEKHLFSYIQSEKPTLAHANVAHASQTGKGLLFFAKRIEDKASPAGIINLGEASSVTKEGQDDFYFTLNGHKHTFQAANKAEADSWVVAFETQITEAKAALEGISSSEGYKKTLSKYAGFATPAAAAAAVGTTATGAKTDKVHDGTLESGAVTTTAAPADTVAPLPATTEKSRSQSRKRQSIFGKVLGKKDEAEEKKEIKKEEKAEKKEEKVEEKAIKKEEKVEAKDIKKEEKAEEKEEKAESKEAKEEEKAEDKATAPKAKRASVFGSLFNKKENASPTREKKESEVVPVVPAKDTETTPAVAPVAPQLDPVATATETTPLDVAVAAVPATTATATTPEPVKDKRRQSFFGNLSSKKEKKEGAISDAEGTDGEGKKPTSGKLGGLFRRVSRSAKGTTSPTHDDSTAPPLPISKDAAATESGVSTDTAAPETTAAVSEPATDAAVESSATESTPAAPVVTASA